MKPGADVCWSFRVEPMFRIFQGEDMTFIVLTESDTGEPFRLNTSYLVFYETAGKGCRIGIADGLTPSKEALKSTYLVNETPEQIDALLESAGEKLVGGDRK